MLARLINSRAWQSQPTYLSLITVVATYGSDMKHASAQVITSVAVFLTFCHMSVGSRKPKTAPTRRRSSATASSPTTSSPTCFQRSESSCACTS